MEEPRNIYDHLQNMRARLRMYLGDTCILNLEHYLHGYDAGLRVHQIMEEGVPRFFQFLSWLIWTQKGTWKYGWARGLLATSKDNDEALERFFNLAAEFGSLRVVDGETLDLEPSHERSQAYTSLNSKRPVPTRLQLMYLQPGEWCYVRSWYGAVPQDDRWLQASVAGVMNLVAWEYEIPETAWGVPIPTRDESAEALQRRWEAHKRAFKRT